MTGRWEHFFHVADVGIRGIGATPGEAFEQAAAALMAVIVDPETVKGNDTVELTCEAPDLELLLVEWLNAIVYAIATRHMMFRAFHVSSLECPAGEPPGKAGAPKVCSLSGTAIGEAVDVRGHAPAVEVKGATYTELKVHRVGDEWIAQCVVDV